MPAYRYIRRCADGQRYTGIANDLRQRLADHERGAVRSTAGRRPVELAYFESHETLYAARQRERKLKSGRTRRHEIDRLIAGFPAAKRAPFAGPGCQGQGIRSTT